MCVWITGYQCQCGLKLKTVPVWSHMEWSGAVWAGGVSAWCCKVTVLVQHDGLMASE